MKTVGFWNYHEGLNNNNFMFTNTNSSIGDDLLLPMVELGKYLYARNVKAATLDLLELSQIDSYVFIDMPDENNKHFKSALNSGKPIYLIIAESPLVRPDNFNPDKQLHFEKIFTYNDSYLGNNKYIKLNYAFLFPPGISVDTTKKKKLCTMIAGKKKLKKINNSDELYTERLKAVKWFEKYHPDDFDLYGFGWGKPYLKISDALNPFKAVKILFTHKYKTYKGKVERKKTVLEKYKFAICYENIRDVPGYITEKIFDSFFAGCVPVYLGAKNITDHIPGNCFIDKRNFNDYESLYEHLVSMTDAEYAKYLGNIDLFLKSDAARAFSCENFVKVITEVII